MGTSHTTRFQTYGNVFRPWQQARQDPGVGFRDGGY